MSETGAVKFTAERSPSPLDSFVELPELNFYRTRLRHLGLIGIDANGIGFGNISVRRGAGPQFYISASGTGARGELKLSDCAKVVDFDLARNWLRFEGTAMASSESLTHAALYQADESVGAILHGHSLPLWKSLLTSAPATPLEVEYGTLEMAGAVQDLFRTTDVRDRRVFAMAGHGEGFISFGRDLAEAYDALLTAMKSPPIPSP